MDIGHIVFPTDFSNNSKKALQFALEIANLADAKITILHVMGEPYDFASKVEDYKESMTKKINDLFHEMTDEINKNERFRDLSVDTLLLSGNTIETILEEIDKSEADLVVMGTKGASGLKKVLFGTVSSEIILRSKLPVLTIPEHCEYHGIDHITFTTDYHSGDLDALVEITVFAELFDSKIVILHIAPVRNLETEIKFRGFRELINEKIEYRKINHRLILKDDFYTGISYYLDDETTRLITQVKYKKPFFQSLLKKDHTKQLGFYTKVPLLVMPGKGT